MAEKIELVCPSCSAKLNVAGEMRGKKIKCPKCKEIFKAEPIEKLEEIEEIEEIEVIEDEDDEPKTPSSRRRATGSSKGSSKKSGKGKSSEGGSATPLIITGVVAVLVVAGVGLYFSGIFSKKPAAVPIAQAPAMPVQPAAPPPPPKAPSLSPAEKVLGLKWLPADTDLIIHLKLADVLAAPLLKEPLSNPAVTSAISELQKNSDIVPADIESVTFGFRGIANVLSTSFKAGVSGQMAPVMRPENQSFVIVLKAKKNLDLKQFLKGTPVVMKEKNGKAYAESPPSPFSPPSGVWTPDPKTFIFATTKELLETIERGETVTPRKEFASLDHVPQLMVAAIIPDLASDGKASNAPQDPNLTTIQTMIQPYGVKMASLGLSVKGGFDLQISALTSSEDSSKQLKSMADLGQSTAKAQLENYKKTGIPLVGELGDMLLANLKIDVQNQIVKVSTNIPDSEQSKIEQLGPILMLAAATGAFNNLGSPTAMNLSPGIAAMPDAAAPPTTFSTQPGETESVDVIKAEGLPDGLKLSAKTAWGPVATGSSEGNKTAPLEILIDVSGDGLETICGTSGIGPKTMTIEGGSLKKFKRTGAGDPLKSFILFDVNDGTAVDHPPQTLRVRVDLEAPTSAATKIDVLEGSFKYLVSTGTQEFTIDEVPKKMKKVITDPEMKALEVKLRRGPSGATNDSVGVVCGKEHFLGKVFGSPGNIVSVTELDKEQTVQRVYSNHEGGKFPEDFQIKFTVHPHVKEQTVTFRFENVPLPSADSKPQ